IARSIHDDGLIHPPLVRQIEGKPDHYELIAGRHRVVACRDILGWTEIPCRVVAEGADPDEIRSMVIAENLWRHALNPEERIRSLTEWGRMYEKRYPGASGKGAYMKRVSAEKKAAAASRKAARPSAQAVEIAKPFSKVIEETLGVSASQAAR